MTKTGFSTCGRNRPGTPAASETPIQVQPHPLPLYSWRQPIAPKNKIQSPANWRSIRSSGFLGMSEYRMGLRIKLQEARGKVKETRSEGLASVASF